MTSLPTSPIGIWVLAARPKTLLAAVAPVLIGTAMAWEAGLFHGGAAFLALLGAIGIQVGTNFYNDYADFVKGADTEDRKGPTRATQAGLVTPSAMKRATWMAFGIAVAAGTYLMMRGGWPIILIGILSIISGLMYTAGKHSLAYLGLGDLFVLIFFGPVAVGGTYYVQALSITPEVILAGFAPGLLAVAILLVNNIRDVEEDRAANKRTLIVRWGRAFGVIFYSFCVFAAFLIAAGLFLYTDQHPWLFATGLILPIAIPIVKNLSQEKDATALNPMLPATARLLLIYSLIFSAAWVLT